jgi:hypothetical protein
MSLQINTRGEWDFSIRRTPANTKPRQDRHVKLGKIARGTWTNWVIHYKRSTSNNGVAQLWKDGKLVVDYEGVTSQSNEPDGLWKFGLYRGAPVESKFFGQEYKIYFDDLKIAHGANQYETVQPSEAASKCLVAADLPRPIPPGNLRLGKQ